MLTSDGGGTSTDVSVVIDGEPTLTTEGSVGAFPSKIPMIDVVTVGAGGGSIAWLSPEGTLKVGPQSAGADPGPLCYGKGGTERRPSPTPTSCSAGSRPTCSAARSRSTSSGRAPASRRSPPSSASRPRRCAAGVLEISAWNQANALRQVTVKRGLDVRDFALTTFGGSGSLLLCRLMDVLGIPTVLVPPNPGNVSAFGLLTVDVKNDYVQTHVALADALDPADVAGQYDELDGPGRRGAEHARASPTPSTSFVRTADLRYFGQAFEVRVAVPEGRSTPRPLDEVADALPRRAPRRSTATTSPPTQPSRSSGSTSGSPASARSSGPRSSVDGAGGCRGSCLDHRGDPAGLLRRRRRVRRHPGPLARRPRPRATVTGPAIIEEFGSTVPLHPGFTARVDDYLNLIVTRSDA